MKLNCKIPLPINLNCWKHHAGFIKKQINSAKKEGVKDSELRKILRVIGESQMDIYLGKLTPAQIAKEITGVLKENGKFKCNDYEEWLNEEKKGYKLLTIPDKSIWTLRLGNEEERFIHIHPGRYSPLTIRVKASNLKTFIASEIILSSEDSIEDELSSINKIRVKHLQLPPLKSFSSSTGLIRLQNIFNSVNS